jgi:hypothetical protein
LQLVVSVEGEMGVLAVHLLLLEKQILVAVVVVTVVLSLDQVTVVQVL